MAIALITEAQRYLKTRLSGVNGLPVVAGDLNPVITAVNDLTDGSISSTTLVLAGVASGTAALTLTAGDIVVTSGDVDMTVGDLTLTDGSVNITDADNAASLSVVNATATTIATGVIPITLDGLTTGVGLLGSFDALTTGEGVSLTHTTSVIADGGSLLRLSSTGIDTGGATNGTVLDVSSTAQVAGSVVKFVGSAITTGNVVDIVGAAVTTGAALNITAAAGGVAIKTTAGIRIEAGTSTLSGAGAIPITQPIAEWTTGAADAGTLADGVEGQRLTIILVTDGGDGTLTPANGGGYSTITFADAGDACDLLFTNGNWYVTGIGGLAPGPVVA